MLTGNRDLAEGVIHRDDDVDRFYLLIFRQFQSVLSDPMREVDMEVERIDLFNVYIVARQLERVADHAVKVAQAALEVHAIPAGFPKPLRRATSKALDLLNRAYQSFLRKRTEEANQILDEAKALDNTLSALGSLLVSKGAPGSAPLQIVLDSIGRARDYAKNVAEVTLNAAAFAGGWGRAP